MPNCSVRLREEIPSQGIGHRAAESSRDSSANQCWFLQSGATNGTLCFCSLIRPDYLLDQGDREESVKKEVGPVEGRELSSEVKTLTSGLLKISQIS